MPRVIESIIRNRGTRRITTNKRIEGGAMRPMLVTLLAAVTQVLGSVQTSGAQSLPDTFFVSYQYLRDPAGVGTRFTGSGVQLQRGSYTITVDFSERVHPETRGRMSGPPNRNPVSRIQVFSARPDEERNCRRTQCWLGIASFTSRSGDIQTDTIHLEGAARIIVASWNPSDVGHRSGILDYCHNHAFRPGVCWRIGSLPNSEPGARFFFHSADIQVDIRPVNEAESRRNRGRRSNGRNRGSP